MEPNLTEEQVSNVSNNKNSSKDLNEVIPIHLNSIDTTDDERKPNSVFAEVVTTYSKSGCMRKSQRGSEITKRLKQANKKVIHYKNKNITLEEDKYGYIQNKNSKDIPIKRFTWKNHNGLEAQVITYGARIISLKMPDKHGYAEDIVLGFDNLAGYVDHDNLMFGATIGRVTGPVENSTFVIDGKQYWLKPNDQEHCVNGGFEGLHKVIWNATVNETQVILTHLSADNHEGFPGEVLIAVTFELSTKNVFSIHMEAMCTKPTILNLSNLCYFNLSGHGGGHNELYKHIVTINSHSYTKMSDNNLPTGHIMNSVFTQYDFQVPVLLRKRIGFDDDDGYDQNFCINRNDNDDICFVARALHIPSGRTLEVYSNQHGVRFSTGNEFGVPSNLISPMKGNSTHAECTTLQKTGSLGLANIQQDILMLLLDVYQRMKNITEVNRNNFEELVDLLIQIDGCNVDHVKALFGSNGMFKDADVNAKVTIAAVIKSIELIKAYIPMNIATVEKWEEVEGIVGHILTIFKGLDNTAKSFTHKVSSIFGDRQIPSKELQLTLQDLDKTLVDSVKSLTTSKSKVTSASNVVISESASVKEEWLKDQLQNRLLKEISEKISKTIETQKTNSKKSSIVDYNSVSERASTKEEPPAPSCKYERIIGKNDCVYSRHCGMALQTQNYPNAVYHRNFPSCILRPNEIYSHKIIYKFWVQSGDPKRWLKREFP